MVVPGLARPLRHRRELRRHPVVDDQGLWITVEPQGKLGDWPAGLPDDDSLLLPASRHFRLLQRIHQPSGGQLTTVLARLPEPDREAMRHPHPEVLQIIDPRPLLDEAASIGARYRTGGLLMLETLAAGLAFGHQLWCGPERNVGKTLSPIAADLHIDIHVIGP